MDKENKEEKKNVVALNNAISAFNNILEECERIIGDKETREAINEKVAEICEDINNDDGELQWIRPFFVLYGNINADLQEILTADLYNADGMYVGKLNDLHFLKYQYKDKLEGSF